MLDVKNVSDSYNKVWFLIKHWFYIAKKYLWCKSTLSSVVMFIANKFSPNSECYCKYYCSIIRRPNYSRIDQTV
jgi:hypothetical protein